jgi:hypothetical protein
MEIVITNKVIERRLWLIILVLIISACNPIHAFTAPVVVPSSTIVSSFTALPTQTQTSTPFSTLSPDQANKYVLNMLRTNGNCEFPCWWGIIPGKSNWIQTRLFLERFALDISTFPKTNGNIKYWVDLPDPERRSWNKRLGGSFFVNQAGIVDAMNVPVQSGNLKDLLKMYGVPTEVWFSFIGDFPGGTLDYSIAFFYSEKGIMAIPGGTGHEVLHGNKKYLKMCSNEFEDYYQLWLWSPKTPKSFYDIAFALDLTSPGEMGFGRIDDVTDSNETEFYNDVSANTNVCFETPYDAWPILSPRP